MAAEKTFKVRGIEVKMWKASFKLDGMSSVLWPTHITEETAKQLIESIYESIEKKAIESANRKVAENVYKLLSK